MESEFIKWIVTQGGIVGIAALSLWMLKATYEDRLRDSKEYADSLRTDRDQLAKVVTENTRVIAMFCERTGK